jgi:hypothetical protein
MMENTEEIGLHVPYAFLPLDRGLSLLTWEQDTFAFADSYDETSRRYRGLRYGQRVTLTDTSSGMLVKPEAASGQITAEAAARGTTTTAGVAPVPVGSGGDKGAGPVSNGGSPSTHDTNSPQVHKRPTSTKPFLKCSFPTRTHSAALRRHRENRPRNWARSRYRSLQRSLGLPS